MPQASETATKSVVHVIHAQPATQESSFPEAIEGNTVTNLGTVQIGMSSFRMACAETEAGAFFPPQYHQGGGNEMAVCISGEGAIVVGEEEACWQSYPFGAGDVLFIPPGIVYHVRNRSTDTPLIAWLLFGEKSVSYWPDGRMA